MHNIKITILLLFAFSSSIAQKSINQKLDSVFNVMYTQQQFNGAVLIAEKGKVIFSKAYGFRDTLSKYHNTTNTIFELASCSKQFTAAAIVLLHRKGLLKYEDPIDRYLPELAFWHQVTIYDLLRHTSGLPEYLVDMPKSWNHTKIATNDDLLKFYAGRADTLSFKPGSMHRYNNTNYALLASIIERTSGESYASFLQKNIFQPLKMRQTFVYNRREQARKISNYAMGYLWKRGSFKKITAEHPSYGDSMVYYLDGIVGSAKVNSTVVDLYKWIRALQQHAFFTKDEFAMMTAMSQTSKGRKVPYGFGLDLSGSNQNLAFGHTGSWDGYATFVYHQVQKNRTIITLQNFKMGAYPFETIRQLLDGKPVTTEFPQKIVLPWKDIEKYTGNYIDEKTGDEQRISFIDGHLVHNSKQVPWDMRFFPISENSFQAIRQGGADGMLKFTELENGEVKLEMLEYGKIIGAGVRPAKK